MPQATRDVVEHKIKKAISERSTLNRNLIVRISDRLHGQLEELAQKMADEMPGKRVTVSDVARILLEHGVRARHDNEVAAKSYRKRRQRDEAETQELVKELRAKGVLSSKPEEGI